MRSYLIGGCGVGVRRVAALVGAAAVLLGSHANAQCIQTFTPAVGYGAGASPYAVTVGDFNADGRPDLAVSNFGSHNVSVYLAATPPFVGLFNAPAFYPVGLSPRDVEAGDFNGDGLPDLAVSCGSVRYVAILLCNPNGTFQPPINTPPLDTQVQTIRVGDYNADGDLDVAVAAANGVHVLLGNGDGTLQPAQNCTPGAQPTSMVLAKFNADNVFDMAYTEYPQSRARVMLGNPDGSFQAPTDFATAFGSWGIAAGRLNSDAHLDLVVTNYVNHNVSVLMGNGDGGFQPAVNSFANQWPTDVVIADLNLDGRNDILTANFGANNISILSGRDDGTFASAVHFPTGLGAYGVATGDFNADGAPDIAVANQNQGLSILFNLACPADFNCDSVVNSQDLFDFLTAFFKQTDRADFNHDGNANSQDFFDFLVVFFEGCD